MWIKVEDNLPDKPEMLGVVSDLGCSQGDAFLAWFRVWIWFDKNTIDGVLPNVTPAFIDRKAELPGFAASLAKWGWLVFDGNGCTVVNWCRHNGQCAKRRAQQAQIMADRRKKVPTPKMPRRRNVSI